LTTHDKIEFDFIFNFGLWERIGGIGIVNSVCALGDWSYGVGYMHVPSDACAMFSSWLFDSILEFGSQKAGVEVYYAAGA